MKTKGIFQTASENVIYYDSNLKITEKQWDKFWNVQFDKSLNQKIILYGDTVEYIIALPDEVFRAFCKHDRYELYCNSNQLKRLKIKAKKIGIDLGSKEPLKKYGKLK